jgi:[protein-PII] uridylyltransferase
MQETLTVDTELTADLFDRQAFTRELKQTRQPLSLFKQARISGNELLNEAFVAGVPINTLVKQRAWLVDQLLTLAWEQIITSEDIALVAVGGYGRGELHPASDIDLMILIHSRRNKAVNQSLEKFLVFLWDIGLEVGHSVRTIKDCISEAKNDITVATNLMESRLLAGNEAIYNEMCKLTGPRKIWPTKKFFAAKLAEQVERHRKYDNSEHKLEPNIKEGPGGLRDIQVIGWVAKRHFGAETLKDLVTHEFLTEDEYRILDSGQSLLWRIRYALHYITGHREDRLLFDYQRSVAELFGFRAQDNSGVEQFMKMYYRTVREMNILNEILLQHFQEAIIYAKRREKIKPLNRRFQIRNNYLEATNNNVFKRYPFALLELFLLIQQNPSVEGVRASTIRLIRKHTNLINREFRQDIRNRSLFMEIIRHPRHVGHELRRMHRYGILSRYLPAFGDIEGLMQFDLFHIYTVDEHILFVVRNLRLFSTAQKASDYADYNKLLSTLPKPELLYLAGLFHDIAKGRNGDHSTLGAKDAIRFCKLHGLSDYDARLVGWLVEHHLLMSKTAQRMDLSDPENIIRFAEIIRDRNHLNYLYLLTAADIQGTNPALWNNWKEALLADLYQKTLLALRRGLENPIGKKALIEETKKAALELIKHRKKTMLDINLLWESLGDDYFIRYSADEIAWHTEAISRMTDMEKPLIMVREQTARGGTEVFVYMKNRDKIFAATTRTLDKLGFTIMDARIITAENDYTLDSYTILERNGDIVSGKQRRDELIRSLQHALTTLDQFTGKITRIKSRQLKHIVIPTRITFTPDEKNNRNIMEVVTLDRPGILSRIGMALNFCGARLQGAKIATYGARVEDIFFITDRKNRIITDPIKFECLRNSISSSLDSN